MASAPRTALPGCLPSRAAGSLPVVARRGLLARFAKPPTCRAQGERPKRGLFEDVGGRGCWLCGGSRTIAGTTRRQSLVKRKITPYHKQLLFCGNRARAQKAPPNPPDLT
ncbi:hypothetical protein K270103H11_17310 [Gordonibacter urolithinfaciens]